MSFQSCPDRDRILEATGYVLVTGGPGCGKTTVALRKALLKIEEGLDPGQKVLFLSFSRAAVARIMEASRRDVPRKARRHLDIQTFHSFCWQFLRGYAYLSGAAAPLRLVGPQDERALRDGSREDNDPDRHAQRETLLRDGKIVFDLFAPKALEILQKSRCHREVIADKFPLIIVDEAQDTGSAQWNCIAQLAAHTQLLCLADLDQQIYDWRPDVSGERVTEIMAALDPLTIDLGEQNNRSPGVEIVKFGNDILYNTPRGAPYEGVSQRFCEPQAERRTRAIRSAFGMVYKDLIEATGAAPQSIAYLTSWGKGVAIITRALQGDGSNKEIPHQVAMDEAEVLLATRAIALCLEPCTDVLARQVELIEAISELYRAKGGAGSLKKAKSLRGWADKLRAGRGTGNARCPPALRGILERLESAPLSGVPAQDWLRIRREFEESGVDELKLVAGLVVYLMAFGRGRRIADLLADTWERRGAYEGAVATIERAIAEEQIMGGDTDIAGLHVMTMHKSKGKEFDAVILVHLENISPFSPPDEQAPHRRSRRLLRVAATRARKRVLLLTDAYNPSVLLRGHNLRP